MALERLPVEGSDFFVYFADLPMQCGGVVVSNDDGTYTMYLNKNHYYDKRQEDYWHEYEHLAYDDFGNGLPLDVIESR